MALFFGDPFDSAIRQLSDAEFLQSLRWNREAPASLVRAAQQGDVDEFTTALACKQGVLRRGVHAKRLSRMLAGKPAFSSPEVCGESVRTAALADIATAMTAGGNDFAAHITKRKKKQRKADPDSNGHAVANEKSAAVNDPEAKLAAWLSDAGDANPVSPFDLMLLLELLPTVARDLPSALRWTLWRTTTTAALEWTASLDELAGESFTDDLRTIITGELPFVAGLLFAGLKGAAQLQRRGVKRLAKQLLDATDNDGTPNAELMKRLPLWLASFVRAKHWADACREAFWDQKTEERFAELIRVAATFCRTDGRLALSNGLATPVLPILTAAAVSSGLQPKSRPVRLLLALDGLRKPGSKRERPPLGKKSDKTKPATASKSVSFDRPGSQSDWAKLACLRTDWSPTADLLAVAHDGDLPRLDFSIAGIHMLDGDWDLDVTRNGEPVSTRGVWESTCWFSDRDVDFIELQHNAGDGLLIDRQVLLSRKLQFAILSDCISGGGEYPVAYQSRLPLVKEAVAVADTETRTVRVSHGKTAMRCYPLALPCDRVHGTAGRFWDADGVLNYSQTAVDGLVAPLLLDWSPDRKKADVEWQKLTVGEQGRGLGSGEACAYRLRVGSLHLLVYRKLKATVESQTVLGLHTRHETVIGRFSDMGEIKPMLLVE